MNNLSTWSLLKKGVLKSQTGTTTAFIDNCAPVLLNGEHFSQTIRTSACELLVHDVKCPCKAYRATLRVIYNRWSSHGSLKVTDTTSRVNERYLNTPKKKAKMKKLKR